MLESDVPVILDFWASWCGPCRMENPNMVKLYNDFKDKGLVVISVSLDERKAAWQQRAPSPDCGRPCRVRSDGRQFRRRR